MIESRGLFEGLDTVLDAAEFDLLDAGFRTLTVQAAGVEVKNAGSLIVDSFHRDYRPKPEVRAEFQMKLKQLLRGCIVGDPPHQGCCIYHNDRLNAIAPQTSLSGDLWLLTFFEILTAFSHDLHFQSPSILTPTARPPIFLSRVMILDSFIRAFTNRPPGAATERQFADELAPDLGRKTRTRARKNKAVGTWGGRIGSYPTPTVAFGATATPFLRFCEAVKPFATLTSFIDSTCDRQGPPDALLKTLGLAFKPNVRWIELIYQAEHAAFISADREHRLGIPTRIESAGNWAYTPDSDAESNHALDLADGRRGRRELVHLPFDHSGLEDAIVWGAPTQHAWNHPTSPIAA